ncbi:glycosyltransferase [Vibrio astriarenae]
MNAWTKLINSFLQKDSATNIEVQHSHQIEREEVQEVSIVAEEKTKKEEVKETEYERAYRIISSSNMFDSDYYLSRYLDVKKHNVDPISHFIRYGAKENRWPNDVFDTKLYKKTHSLKDSVNPLLHYICNESTKFSKLSEKFNGTDYYYLNTDVSKSGLDPLYHYVRYGRNEGRKTVVRSVVESSKSYSQIKVPRKVSSQKITVIVPVYNAIDEVTDCIESVILNTRLGDKISLLIINDASPDTKVAERLSKFESVLGVRLETNPVNLGYTKTINKGIGLSGSDDIVLLNSDTIVTPNWLTNLTVAAKSSEVVGTVTAVSNGAGAFSVPNSGYNEIPEGMNPTSISRVISKEMTGRYIDVPTGNGFCLYIKNDLISDIGLFDEIKFPKGYGEENDFCMRAIDSGWKNLVDPKTYVYHKRSASFKESKTKLIESGVNQVKHDYPFYKGAIRSIGSSPIFSECRKEVLSLLTSSKPGDQKRKPNLMFVISTRTGGTPKTNYDLMRGLKDIYSCLALASNGKVIEVLKAGDNDYEVIEKFELNQPLKYATHSSNEYEELVNYILHKYSVELLHIRHIAWHSLSLPKIAKELYIPVVKSFHDFYAVCPSVNLLNSEGELFLDGMTKGDFNPLWRDDETSVKHSSSTSSFWKNRMKNALSCCDAYVTTCESAKMIISNAFGGVNEEKFQVIPHGRDFSSFLKPENKIEGRKLKVLLPGNITLSKGKELIKAIKELDSRNELEFHVLGTCDEDLMEYVIYHGTYRREEFLQKVAEINPHISGVFSIWPETYCHTLTESWAAGLPVIGVAYGAVEDRIKKHKAGWLVPNNSEECYKQLIAVLDDNSEYSEKLHYVEQWQKGFGNNNTVSSMTGKYVKIYEELLSTTLPYKNKIALIVKGDFPNNPPTAYVRIIDWMDVFEQQFNLYPEVINWSELFSGEVSKYEKVIIQRDAIPEYAVEWCIYLLKKNNIPYIYEIDDYLLEVPEEVDPLKTYESYRSKFEILLSNAESVRVTNDYLASKLEKFNDHISIVPNRIFDERWSRKLVEKLDLNLNNDNLNLLYYGSRTHQEELDFIISVVKEANENGLSINLYVVGAGDFIEGESIVRLIPPSSRYDLFVDWMTKISHNFDFGVVPLMESNFSKSKSNLKCLEFEALGLDVIGSNVYPYNDVNFSNATLVNNEVEEWASILSDKFRRKVK